jgi:hypothetical protein
VQSLNGCWALGVSTVQVRLNSTAGNIEKLGIRVVKFSW